MKRSTRVFWLMLTLWLAACAQQPPLPPLNLAEPLPAVGAQFETERRYVADHDHEAHHVQADSDVARSEWLFWRQDARVEMLIPARQAGEAWLRDGNAVFHQKLFHADHKIVEYQDADLDALQVSVNWNARVLLLDPQVLQQLQVKDEYWQDGHPLRELAGTVAGIQYEVIWRLDLNLPQLLRKQDAAGNLEITRLLDAQPLAAFSAKAPDSSRYEIIDYADLGDRERDPFIARIQNQLPGGHVHTH